MIKFNSSYSNHSTATKLSSGASRLFIIDKKQLTFPSYPTLKGNNWSKIKKKKRKSFLKIPKRLEGTKVGSTTITVPETNSKKAVKGSPCLPMPLPKPKKGSRYPPSSEMPDNKISISETNKKVNTLPKTTSTMKNTKNTTTKDWPAWLRSARCSSKTQLLTKCLKTLKSSPHSKSNPNREFAWTKLISMAACIPTALLKIIRRKM